MKKAISMLMAGTMAAGLLAGCSGSSTPASSASSAATTDTASSTAAAAPAKISFMLPSYYGTDLANNGSDQVIQKCQEYTNTELEFRWEANDTYKDKLGLTLMDKDNMPMILTCPGLLTANVIDAAKKGAFWDLTDYLKDAESYPNLAQANENVLKSLTVDGQVIAVYRARAIGRYGFSYRTDWAENVGITEAPKTIEDVYNMLYKFTYEDPDGNGQDDTYGLEMTKYTGPWDIMQTWFGVGNLWVEEDGKYTPVHQTAEYKEALEWMHKIYTDGLVRPDWATVDTSTWSDGCKKGESGVFIDVMDSAKRIWNYYTDNDVKSVTDPTTTATMTMVGPIAKDATSEARTLATTGYNGFYVITKSGAKTEEDLKNCLHFLDKMCDPKMMELADFGIEGIDYTLNENGNVVLDPNLEVSQHANIGLNQTVAYIPNLASPDLALEKRESDLKQDEMYAYNEQYAVMNPAAGYLANSSVYAEVGTDIDQILDDARTQYICGQIDDAGLESAFQQWNDRGGTQLIEEVNQLASAG
ncbi:MAG: ABC transporter substrate-binding protein [Gemmiger sp.]|nr:ABC transporter substrate-binding protein [Gemmiger sp.]